MIAALLRFLGGLNLALAALSVLAADDAAFGSRNAVAPLLEVIALAHLSQVAVDLPIAVGEHNGRRGPWRVTRGIMLCIFTGDLILAIISLAAGILLS